MLEGLIVTGITYLFPGELALKLVKNGVNLINSTNHLRLTKNITLTVLNCCAPLLIKLVAHCLENPVLRTSRDLKDRILAKVSTRVALPAAATKNMF